MKIPLQKIKVCRMTYLGENLRSVGYIDQTVQCVQNGIVQGTIHLSHSVEFIKFFLPLDQNSKVFSPSPN